MRLWLYLVIKRLIDIFISATALILLSPLMLLIALIIKVSSPGPLFFRQQRVGLNGREFNLVKFRTMVYNAEKMLSQLKEYHERDSDFVQMKNDPRVFYFGKILRKLSLDELPQLLNILAGNMSLVGPRPLLKEELSNCDDTQLRRLKAKPGLTGWSQINGRGDLSFDNRMKLDLDYINKRSLVFDSIVLLKTIWVVLSRHGVY